jgi:23S rRNA pseudouridine1911/1915/1917 synthase
MRWTIGPNDNGVRLDKYLAAPERLGSRARALDALARGKIFFNGREADADLAGRRLAAGDEVRVWMDRPGSSKRRVALGEARDLPIVYQDDHLFVLNKPAGVLAVPLPPDRREGARSVFDDLKAYLSQRRRGRPHVVHRIDRDTSGLVVFAATPQAQARLKAQFTRRLPERVYLAVVHGHPSPAAGTWRDRLVWDRKELMQKAAADRDSRAKDAISRYRIVDRLADASLLEVALVTGRQNQIRVQARLHGHPIVGEQRYTGDEQMIAFPRQALHAHRLAFAHPADGRPLRFEAPLPDDLTALIARLTRRR